MAFEPRRTTMPRKRHKPEEIVAKLRQVDVLVSQGQSVAEAVRSIGVTEVTYYRWRQEFGGLKSDQVKRLKDLETENTRLRRAIADLTLDKLILQEASPGKLLSPARRRVCILRGARPASLDAAQGPPWSRRRGAAQRRHRRACSAVRTLRLPQDRRAAAPSRLAHQRQAGRADLATRGAEGPQEATQTRTALADERIVHPAAARASQPRLVLRLRRGPDARQTEVPDAQRHRRVHARVLGDPRRSQAQGHRRHRSRTCPSYA